ncbi:hypothetical protein C7271_06250 [filamentous cyanobacterium CCP5]|nr:hypothetical protein C7271_06250 [filamentous cyanobacterium CCP5]
MTKHLILFRHGKSDWDADFANDHERPVATRGVKAAQTMGKLLAIAHQVPEAVISSSALRAKTTAELAIAAGSWDCDLHITDDLYETSLERTLKLVYQQPDALQSLMLVGHQPTWSELTQALIGGGTVEMPTAAMACISFEAANWRSVCFGSGQLKWLLQPKFFTKGDFDTG